MNNIFEKYGSGNCFIFKISLIAMENVGKETLLKNYFKDGYFDIMMMTHGVVFITKDLELYGKGIRSIIWVFSLTDQFRKLFRYYITGSNGVILMYDITNRETLSYLSEYCHILDYDPPQLLVGNKLDLEKNRRVSKEDVEKFKEKNDISNSIEISLKTGKNLEHMFTKITEMILKKYNYI